MFATIVLSNGCQIELNLNDVGYFLRQQGVNHRTGCKFCGSKMTLPQFNGETIFLACSKHLDESLLGQWLEMTDIPIAHRISLSEAGKTEEDKPIVTQDWLGIGDDVDSIADLLIRARNKLIEGGYSEMMAEQISPNIVLNCKVFKNN